MLTPEETRAVNTRIREIYERVEADETEWLMELARRHKQRLQAGTPTATMSNTGNRPSSSQTSPDKK